MSAPNLHVTEPMDSGLTTAPDPAHRRAVAHLTALDPDLAAIVATHGEPPTWYRPPGFATLVLLILEQQVSLASARAAFDRAERAAGTMTPEAVLGLDDATLRAVGFSRQKTRYVRALAQDVASGALDLDSLASLDDAPLRARLCQLVGIGPWTAEVYAMSALRRPDVWPVGDLALRIALAEVKRLAARPDADTMLESAAPWRPYRSTAARILWHHYLQTPRSRRRRR